METIDRRLVLALSLAIIALIAVGAWLYVENERQLQLDAQANLEAIAQLKVDRIAEWRAEKLRDATVISKSPFLTQAIHRWLDHPQEDLSQEILQSFRLIKENYHYLNVLLVDANGRIRLSLNDRLDKLHEGAAQGLGKALRDRRPVLTDCIWARAIWSLTSMS